MAILTNLDELIECLSLEKREVSATIAVRAALRVLPLFVSEYKIETPVGRSRSETGQIIILPVFRAMALALATAKYPTKVNELLTSRLFAATFQVNTAFSVDSFAHSTLSFALSASGSARSARSALGPTRSALFAAASADTAAADGAYGITAVTPHYATYMATIAADAAAADGNLIRSGGTAKDLARQTLWLRERPKWVDRSWAELQSYLRSHRSGWQVWVRWYEAVLNGKDTPGGEDLDIYRVLLGSEEDWQKSPREINRMIKQKEEELERRSESSTPPLDLTQYPASFNFDFLNDQIVAKPVLGGENVLPDADDIRVHLVGKFAKAAERLAQTQCVPRYPETFRRAASLIASRSAHQLSAGQVLMAFRSMEADAAAIMSPDGRAEFAPDVIALVEDALRSFEDFKAQLPNVIRLETNRLTLELATGNAAAVNTEIGAIAAAAERAAVVSSSAVLAVRDGEIEFERYQLAIETSSNTQEIAAAKEAQAATVAQRSLVVRNMVARSLKFVGESAAKGLGSGIEKAVEASTITAVAGLIGAIAGPFGSIAMLIASFRPLAKKAEDVSNRQLPPDMKET